MSTPFTPTDIWTLISKIPIGKVATYGQLAEQFGAKDYARVVGNILRQLPHNTNLPWHRVVNSKGYISFPEDSIRYNKQKTRLEKEGIAVLSGRINLSEYQWHGE